MEEVCKNCHHTISSHTWSEGTPPRACTLDRCDCRRYQVLKAKGCTLDSNCSGCTDPNSEGTHQGCTREHGHVGCTATRTI